MRLRGDHFPPHHQDAGHQDHLHHPQACEGFTSFGGVTRTMRVGTRTSGGGGEWLMRTMRLGTRGRERCGGRSDGKSAGPASDTSTLLKRGTSAGSSGCVNSPCVNDGNPNQTHERVGPLHLEKKESELSSIRAFNKR